MSTTSATRFAKHDPDNAATYAANAEAYKREAERDRSARCATGSPRIPDDGRWLVTCEGAFSYLARDFGMKELYLWPINADQVGTPQQVRAVIDAVREHDIPAVFCESTVNTAPAEQVARETGATYGGVLYVDSLQQADGPVPTYLDLLRVTSQTIADGLDWRQELTRRPDAATLASGTKNRTCSPMATARQTRQPTPAGRGTAARRRHRARQRHRHLPQRPHRAARRQLRRSRAAPSPRWSASTAPASPRCSRRSWASSRPRAARSGCWAGPSAQALRENLVAYVPQAEEVDWAFPVLVEDVVMMGRYGHMGFLRRAGRRRPRRGRCRR